MPQDLPGFYFDEKKNRYFPLKGRFHGYQTLSKRRSIETITEATNITKKARLGTSKLLLQRELNGNAITCIKGKHGFMHECLKSQVSHLEAWRFDKTRKISDGALGEIHLAINTPSDQKRANFLITASSNGLLSLFETEDTLEHANSSVKCFPHHVWSSSTQDGKRNSKPPAHIAKPVGALWQMPSGISSLKVIGNGSKSSPSNDNFHSQKALITTIGSEASGGSVYMLNVIDHLNFEAQGSMHNLLQKKFTSNWTIWTADFGPYSTQAIVGTHLGAALINLETKSFYWLCHSKSDILALQLNQSGNVVLCGFRNGAIATVDTRERFNARFDGNDKCILSPPSFHNAKPSKHSLLLKGNIRPSYTYYMPSAVCSLLCLQYYDQHFLASSMDGSISLFDQRMPKRGCIQSYEGHVNSHSPLQFNVDPLEKFLLAGGEDCYLRIWDIRSGEMLFAEKFSDSAPSTVYFPNNSGRGHKEWHSSGAWVGSEEGLFYLRW